MEFSSSYRKKRGASLTGISFESDIVLKPDSFCDRLFPTAAVLQSVTVLSGNVVSGLIWKPKHRKTHRK